MFGLGATRDVPDLRDFGYPKRMDEPPLPNRMSLESEIGRAYTQTADTCVGLAIAGIAQYYVNEPVAPDDFALAFPGPCSIRQALKALKDPASPWKELTYARCRGLDEVKRAIHQQGPVLIGIAVDPDHLSALPLAASVYAPNRGACTSFHAMVAVGFDDSIDCLRLRNSWGPEWCDSGHCWLPYDYLAAVDPDHDAWVLVLEDA